MKRPLIGLFLLLIIVLVTDEPLSAQDVEYTIERYVTAHFPVGLVFAPDGRLFYTEKITGNVRVVSVDGVLQPKPVIHLDTDALQERGMLGIALDPFYEENGFIWVFHTALGTSRDFPSNKIVRFHEDNGVGTDPVVMLSVPITNGQLLHNGGNLHFDEDGLLYVSFGDYGDVGNAQDLDVIPGKIHRFQVVGDRLVPAPGNPFANTSVYAFGLRNPFDFTIDPFSGRVFATENGLHCDDEVNLILPGFNYGWGPDYECVGTGPIDQPFYARPLLSYTPTEAPTGIAIYDHPAILEWRGDMFFCSWNFGTLRRVILDEARTDVMDVHEIDLQGAQCRIDITVGPEGGLYFGTVEEEDGAIYRLLPADR